MRPTHIRLVTLPNLPSEEKLAFLRDTLHKWIDDKEQELREAAEVLMSDLGAIGVRLDKSPRKARLGDIRTGEVYSIQTKLDTLISVLDIVEGLIGMDLIKND